MWAYSNNGVHSLPARGARPSRGNLPPAIRRALALANPLRWLRAWQQREATVQELYGLDDRTLADLGITQGDFPRILDGSFRRGE